MLANVNAELKAMGSVNLQALEQYTNFQEQRTELVHRQADNDRYACGCACECIAVAWHVWPDVLFPPWDPAFRAN